MSKIRGNLLNDHNVNVAPATCHVRASTTIHPPLAQKKISVSRGLFERYNNDGRL